MPRLISHPLIAATAFVCLAALLMCACTERRSEETGAAEEKIRDVSAFLPGHGPNAPAWRPSDETGKPGETSVGRSPARMPAEMPSSEGEAIQGSIRVASSSTAPSGGVLFIIARRAGRTGAPPVAVKRIVNPQFPLSYALTNADSMIPGRPLLGEVNVVARLDSDGNVSTREAGDLFGAFTGNPATLGTSGVDIELAPE